MQYMKISGSKEILRPLMKILDWKDGHCGAQRGMDLSSRAPEFRVNLEGKIDLLRPD